jgi:hypothetical protein
VSCAVIFCSTRRKVEVLADQLTRRKFFVSSIVSYSIGGRV